MVQLYKQEIQWTRGKEYLHRFRVRENTPLERFYASCCGSPIGFASAAFKPFPFFVVYLDLLAISSPSNFNYPVSFRLNVANVPREKRGWHTDHELSIESEHVSVKFLLKFLGRMIYGLIAGKYHPDPTEGIDVNYELLNLPESK